MKETAFKLSCKMPEADPPPHEYALLQETGPADERQPACPCRKTDCKRHGRCDVCREHHRSKGKPAACERKKIKEDRKNDRKNRK